MSTYIRQPKPSSLMLENQFFMVYSQKVEQGGLEIMHMYGVFDNIVAKFTGFTMGVSLLDTTPCHPHGKTPWVVIATVIFFCQLPLRIIGSAKLSSPDNQGIIQ
jgi:hypothetical protein